MDIAHRTPLSMGFSKQEYWRRLPSPSPGELPNPRVEHESHALVDGFFTTKPLSSVQSLSHAWLFATPWTAACQVSLSITNSKSLLKLMSIESVMPSNHLILSHPLFLLPSVFPSIRVFSNELVSLHQVAKILEFQLQPFQLIFRTVFL